MKKTEYREELCTIHVSEAWKLAMKEKLLEELTIPSLSKKPFYKQYKPILSYGCLGLVIVTMCVLFLYETPHPKEQPIVEEPRVLEKIALSNEFGGGGMGFEGYMMYSPEELRHHSPFDIKSGISKLPVYKNQTKIGPEHPEAIIPRAKEKQIEILENFAKKLNIQTYEIQTHGKPIPDDSGYVIASLISDECTMQMDSSDNSVMIYFSEEYLSNNKILMDPQSESEAEEITKRLYEKYKDVLMMEKPWVDNSCDYNIYHQKHWIFKVSEDRGDETKNLVEGSFHSTIFYQNDDHVFHAMRIFFTDLSGYMGDYPMISLEEAEQRLLEGQYFTTGPKGDTKQIVYVEMVYNTRAYLEYYVPYYKFYMPIEDASIFIEPNSEQPLLRYVAYYVPAITSEYLLGLPQDGQFVFH